MTYSVEMYRPAILSVSLHEIQFDKFEIEYDENFVPKPILFNRGSFEIVLEIYEFKYVYFD